MRLAGRDVYKRQVPVVLLPTAYSNVTKTELGYAELVPEQKFLVVLARESAAVSPLPANVEAVRLASFAAKRCDKNELLQLELRWKQMEKSLQEHAEFRLAAQVGTLDEGTRWLRWGLAVRDCLLYTSRCV